MLDGPLIVAFENIGPYHHARLKALSAQCDVIAVQFKRVSDVYNWRSTKTSEYKICTLPEQAESWSATEEATFWDKFFSKHQPVVTLCPGYADRLSTGLALASCRKGVPTVCMSDSQEIDAKRYPFREFVKSRVLKCFSAAFVAGTRHKEYFLKLGVKPEQIVQGYDVVDNDHFEKRSTICNTISEATLLACARLVEKKNLDQLIEHVDLFLTSRPELKGVLSLRIVGDGPLRADLTQRVESSANRESFELFGHAEYEKLPELFARSQVFIHYSTIDQWGLVVNEAMAASLPVIVSNRCGCAPDLVHSGVNGFVVDPDNMEELWRALDTLVSDKLKCLDFGEKSSEIISKWSPTSFAHNAISVAEVALDQGSNRVNFLARMQYQFQVYLMRRSKKNANA